MQLDRQSIHKLLLREDNVGMHAVGRALVRLMERQTRDEQQDNDTRWHNMVGFTPADARAGTITAKYYLKHGKLEDWQLEKWRKPNKKGVPRICKYANQLLAVAQEKQQVKEAA